MRRAPSAVVCAVLDFAFVLVLAGAACAVQYGPYNTTLFVPSNGNVQSSDPAGATISWADAGNAKSDPSTFAESTEKLNDPGEYTPYLKMTSYGITSTLTSIVRGVPSVASGIVGVTATVIASNDGTGSTPNRFYRGALIIGGTRSTECDLTSFVILSGSSHSFYLGGPSELWGASPTPNQVRDGDFGFAVSVGGTDGSGSAQKARVYSVGLSLTWSMPAVNVSGIFPTSGPEAGGTSIFVETANASFVDLTSFTSQSSPLCRFGTFVVSAQVATSRTMTCNSPAGSGVVNFEISLDGLTFTNDGATFTYDSAITTGVLTIASTQDTTTTVAAVTTELTGFSSGAASTAMVTSAAVSPTTASTTVATNVVPSTISTMRTDSAGTTSVPTPPSSATGDSVSSALSSGSASTGTLLPGGSSTGYFFPSAGSTTGKYLSSSAWGTTEASKQAEAEDSGTGGWVMIVIIVCAIVCCLVVLAVSVLMFRRHQDHPSVFRAEKRHASLRQEMDSDDSSSSCENVSGTRSGMNDLHSERSKKKGSVVYNTLPTDLQRTGSKEVIYHNLDTLT